MKRMLGPGTCVGPYEIRELLGAGGMGEVYRATDPRLSRDVAIKVLRIDRLDPVRLEGMSREARAIASLNHPNIVATYDTGVFRGSPFVVFELLEGQSLRERLRRRDVTPQKALDWSGQVAQALAAAHANRIAHLDLKPENIFITASGHVKLLDFGLAQLFESAPAPVPDDGPSDTPTGDVFTTPAGVHGTPAYMSPEQAQGMPVDHRSDIFSFGAVLYEMLAGRRAFGGPTAPAILGAVIGREPPTLTHAPPAVRRIVERCLEKNPAQRFQSAHDLALSLRVAADAVTAPAVRHPVLRWALGAALLAAVGIAGPRLFRSRAAPASARDPAPASPMESMLLTSDLGRELEPALARDGQRVTFVWDGPQADNFDLYTKVIGAETALRLTTHPAHDGSPAWSPDGRWIAFIRVEGSRGTLLLIPSTGGPERKLRDISPWFGSSVSFSPDGRWIALSERPAPGKPFGVVLLATDTRETRVLTRPGASLAGDAFPTFSPDGQTLAFARVRGVGAALHFATLSVVPTSGGETRALVREDHVVGGVDWTRDGSEIVFSADRGGEGPRLWRVPVAGGEVVRAVGQEFPISNLLGAEALTQVSRFFRFSVAFGADRLAYAHSQYHTDIWRLDVASAHPAAPRPFAASTQIDEAPQFSPDGRRVAFSSTRGSKSSQIWVCDVDGRGCAQITTFKAACGTPRWSPDSQRLAFDAGETGQSEIFVVDVATGVWRQFTFDKATDVVPSWSRDGASIYFSSDCSGAFQVWRMPVAGGPAVPITTEGGFAAFESPDGGEVYFTRYEKPGLWAMPARGGPERSVLDQPACWGYWALAPHGVFILDSAGPRGPRIALHRWGAARLEDVADAPAAPACGESGLALSLDGRTLLYVGTTRESDIVMIDHFR